MKDVREIVQKYYDKVVAHRRLIHSSPELTGQEVKTSAYVASVLREIGLEPVENVGGHGVVALIQGKGPGKCVGLRADMDALPIPECTGLPFASANPGVSHACGHDMHTAMLLGAAYVLNELKDEFNGTIKLVFQPAEEDPMASGAKRMIEEGVMENPHIDLMLGQHVWPNVPYGKMAIRNGAMMASSDRFFITVHGKASHGSAPENGIDAITISAQIISALQTIVSRNVSPLDSAVVTIGTIHGGNRYNVIADTVVMEGTCRNLNPRVRRTMPDRIGNIARQIADSMGGRTEFSYVFGYSPTVNDPQAFELVADTIKEVMGEENLVIPPNSALGGEDFSFYGEKTPSCFIWLGTTEPGTAPEDVIPIHNGALNPIEDAMTNGMTVMVTAALKYLENPTF